MSTKDQMNNHFRKLQSFCAYRERCTLEVQKKLKELGAGDDQTEKIIDKLKNEGFVDDKRFAETYTRGKLLNNAWGRYKIELHLKELNIPGEFISKGFEAIEQEDYRTQLQKLIKKKSIEEKEQDSNIRKGKIARYCIRKGFEPFLVWEVIKEEV